MTWYYYTILGLGSVFILYILFRLLSLAVFRSYFETQEWFKPKNKKEEENASKTK